MKTLSQIFGIKPVKGTWGIEIEAEGDGMREIATKHWRCDDDPSLRGRWPGSRNEFVLKAPIPTSDVENALVELSKALPDARFKFSFRTSVHVHMNVSEFTKEQICSIVYLYLLFEEPLINYCGQSRKANRFTLRLRDAEYMMENIKHMFSETSDDWYRMPDDQMRYSSMNLEAMRKYMSIEFRGMRGTMDHNVIITWVNLLNFIREYASNHSVQEINKKFLKVGPLEMMKEVFGELVNELAYEDMERDMARSYSIAIDLPYSYKDQEENIDKYIDEGPFLKAPKQPAARKAPVQAQAAPIRWEDAQPIAPIAAMQDEMQAMANEIIRQRINLGDL